MIAVWKSEPYYNILIVSRGYNPHYHTQEEDHIGFARFSEQELRYIFGFVLGVAKAKIYRVPISHASKVMLKIFQVRLQQHVNRELLDVEAGFRKGRGTRDQIANIRWIKEKAREFQKNICFIDYAKAFDCVDHNKLWKNVFKRWQYQTTFLPPEKSVCRSRRNS